MNRFQASRRLLVLIVLVAALGCRPAEQIRTYTVPKEVAAPRAAASTSAGASEATDRMLTAIVPEKSQAWFYKVVGTIAAVGEHEEEVLKFVGSVPLAGGAALPAWKLPEGWSSRPGSDGVTLATIQVPAEGKPLELTVTSLPWTDTPDGLLVNVNRWRVQMGLAPLVSAADMKDDTREMTVDEKKITIVDLKGVFRRAGMPPFAGRGAMTGGTTRGSATRGDLPAGHPPMAGGTMPADANHGVAMSGAGAQAAPPILDVPTSWAEAPAGGLNRAAYRITSENQEAIVTVSNIPMASGAMFADPLQNANLWRAGVGLPDITADELKETSEAVEIGGDQGTLVNAIPDASQPEATLAAVVKHGDQIWYFKLKGSRQLVVDRKDEFKAFLKSVKFAE